MKKLYGFLLIISIALSVFLSVHSVDSYATEDKTVILMTAKSIDSRKFKVYAELRENTGIYSMLTQLLYDDSFFTLVGVEYGKALNALDPLSSGELTSVPFRISWLSTESSNDKSTGVFIIFVFELKENIPDGEYEVTLDYTKNKDITYISNGKLETKNVIIDGAVITIADGVLYGLESIEDNNSYYNPDNNDQKKTNEVEFVVVITALLLVIIVVIAVVFTVTRRKSYITTGIEDNKEN